MKTKILFCLLVTLSISAIAQSGAEWNAYKAANGINPSWTYNQWVGAGMPRGSGGGNSGQSQAQMAAQQAAVAAQQAAAAKQQRQNEADGFTQQGSDAFNRNDFETAIKYFQDALEKTPDDSTITDWIQKAKDQIAAKKQREQEAFDKSKQDGLNQLRGLAQGGNIDSDTGLKGIGSTDSGLKGVATASDSGLKTLSDVNTDPMVVDARNVPSGLPKDVDAAIPHTPAGERMRKGYEALQTGDWKVALAWFQDALNHEPGDPDLQRLVDLGQFTLIYRTQTQTGGNNSPAMPATPLPGQNPAAKPDETPWALLSANSAAATARAGVAFEQYTAKYGNGHAFGRAAAQQAALSGAGYTKAELKEQLQEALKAYHKRHDNSPVTDSVDGWQQPTADEIILGGKG